MLLKVFKRTGPDVIVLIFLISILVWLEALLHPSLSSSMGYDLRPMPFFAILLKITAFNPLISVLLTLILTLLMSFCLVNFNTSDFFIGERTFLPALVYILLSGALPSLQVLNPVLPAAIFLVLALRRIMDSYKVQGVAYSFFDAGLLISMGSLFYCNFIWFGLLLLIGIIILRTGNIKEIIIAFLGLAAPWFIVLGFIYVTGKDLNAILSDIGYNLFSKTLHNPLPLLTIILLSVAGVIFIISSVHLLSAVGTKKVKTRKTFNLLFWIFLLSAALYLIFHSVSVEILWLAAIPASYFISHYFVFARTKLMPNILFSILLVTVALIQVMNFMQGSH